MMDLRNRQFDLFLFLEFVLTFLKIFFSHLLLFFFKLENLNFINLTGINPASAAWWTMASHLAAQDYLARLQGAAGLSGFSSSENLLPPYPASLLNTPMLSSHKPSKCKYINFLSFYYFKK